MKRNCYEQERFLTQHETISLGAGLTTRLSLPIVKSFNVIPRKCEKAIYSDQTVTYTMFML